MLRREFIGKTLGGALGLLMPNRPLVSADGKKRLEGIFPIMQTPFTESDRLDIEALAQEVRFLDRAGVHGVVWPQLASEYASLTLDERMEGAEAIVEAGRGLRPAVVIGVQGKDKGEASQYARHAEKLGPDAIIALPPRGITDLDRIAEYYRAIARRCRRPLFVQTIGDMSVDFMIRLASEIPTLRYVKDEAGATLARISEYRARAKELIPGVFTGGHGKTLLDEMARGSSGTMPAASFADLYVRVWNLWHAGRHNEAWEKFARVALIIHQVGAYGLPSLKYILQLRGVFKNHRCRQQPGAPFDAEVRRAIDESYRFIRDDLTA